MHYEIIFQITPNVSLLNLIPGNDVSKSSPLSSIPSSLLALNLMVVYCLSSKGICSSLLLDWIHLFLLKCFLSHQK